MEERIVCAANRNSLGDIVLGVRHHCPMMNSAIVFAKEAFGPMCCPGFSEQGFITNKGRFVDRKEGWTIAVKNNQIVRRCGGDTTDGGTLYSENLY